MDEGDDRREKRDDGEYRPAWPKRPDAGQLRKGQPRLDPPLTSRNIAGSAETEDDGAQAAPSKWTSTPTSHNVQGYPVDDPASTRVLPIVDGASRFESGRRGQPQTPPQLQARAPQVKAPQPQSRPQSQPSPQFRAQQPLRQPPNLAGWQNDEEEYDDDGYNSYIDRTLPYTPQQRSLQGRQTSAPTPRVYPQANINAGKSYLSVQIDGVKQRPRVGWILWLLSGVIGIALIAGAAFALAWQGQYEGKVYSGVTVLGIDVSGKTPDEAKQLLNDKVKAFATQPVILNWNGKEWRPSLDDIGVKLSVDSTVDRAYAVGRESDFFGNIQEQWTSAQTGYAIPLTVQLSEPTLKDYLDNIAKNEINQELDEGDVRLNGTQIEATPGQEGRTLNVYGAIDAIRTSVAKLEPAAKVALPVDTVEPTVSADEVSEVKDLLTVRLSSPLTATSSVLTQSFTISQQQLIDFTTIERNPDRTAKTHIQLGWKDDQLKILAGQWSGQANVAPQDAKFTWSNGALGVKSESIDGFKTDSDSIIQAIKSSADTPDKRAFALPGTVLTPTISSKDLPSLGITDLIGTGTSTFVGSSPERATNIEVAGQLLDGTVVAPGGTFSFLKTMGGIDEAHGFVEGYVIAAERTVLGVGGGVCQTSTTMFRAAFYAGMDITERNQHAYRVSWYEADGEPVGFDAAVFDPGVDLKFVNNTGHFVLIQTVLDPSRITINIYGTKQPDTVKLEGPAISDRLPPPADVYEVDPRLAPGTKKQVETAHAGLTTVITRRIVTPGLADKVDTFKSVYEPWPNWYVVASPAQIPAGSQLAPNPTPNP